MNKIPKELEEHQLNLQIVVDPETKCLAMRTLIDEIPENLDVVSTEIISNDPLKHSETEEEIDYEKMTDLDRLIYSERQRLLNLKKRKKSDTVKDLKMKDEDIIETDSYQMLTYKEKSKLRMRKLREKESLEEREFRIFRARVNTMKSRLLQKLQNFDDDTLLQKITKRNIDRIKQKRLEVKAKETQAQRALRKSRENLKNRLLQIRRKIFRTPEEMLAEKEKRALYMRNIRSLYTEEQRKSKRKIEREKAKERRRKSEYEWKKVEMVIKKGLSVDEFAVKSELMENL